MIHPHRRVLCRSFHIWLGARTIIQNHGYDQRDAGPRHSPPQHLRGLVEEKRYQFYNFGGCVIFHLREVHMERYVVWIRIAEAHRLHRRGHRHLQEAHRGPLRAAHELPQRPLCLGLRVRPPPGPRLEEEPPTRKANRMVATTHRRVRQPHRAGSRGLPPPDDHAGDEHHRVRSRARSADPSQGAATGSKRDRGRAPSVLARRVHDTRAAPIAF